MHERTCDGVSETGNRRECVKCGVWASKSNFARHVRGCDVSGRQEGGE